MDRIGRVIFSMAAATASVVLGLSTASSAVPVSDAIPAVTYQAIHPAHAAQPDQQVILRMEAARAQLAAVPTEVRVLPGDTMSKIASRVFHNPNDWPTIWWANHKTNPNPSSIRVGEELVMPKVGFPTASLARRAKAALGGVVRTVGKIIGKPAPVSSGTAQQIAESMLGAYGWSSSQFPCLNDLWTRESGWRTTAENPSGAYGIPQALPGGKMASAGADWATSPTTQIRWGLGYIKGTYGSPCGAWSHEEGKGWY